MKTIAPLKLLAALICIICSYPSLAIKPITEAPLIIHLEEVNQFWSEHSHDLQLLHQPMSFSSENERIQMHLLLVSEILKGKDTNFSGSVLKNRLDLLSALEDYAKQGLFPLNTRHQIRIPYFVDDFKTPCAVGKLLLETQQHLLVDQIVEENNYAYLLDMPYPEINKWADKYGFTLQELAWIQPAYPPPLASWDNMGGGVNGEVKTMILFNNFLVIGGEFSNTASGVDANNVVAWNGQDYLALGNGLNGVVYCSEIHNNELLMGGFFNGGAHDIAKWNGTNWEYESAFASKAGLTYDLASVNGSLFAAGSAQGFAGPSYYVALKNAGNWMWLQQFNDEVLTLEDYNSAVVAGGKFSGMYVGNLLVEANKIVYYGNSGWLNMGDSIDHDVHDLHYHEPTGVLYAAGPTHDENFNETFGLARLDYDIGTPDYWTPVFDQGWFSPGFVNSSVDHIFSHEEELFFAGDFQLGSWTIYGNGLAAIDLSDTLLLPQLFFVSNDGVNSGTIFQDRIHIGGEFTNLTGVPFNHLAAIDLNTSLSEADNISIKAFPNPVSDIYTVQLENSDWDNSWQFELLDIDGKRYETVSQVFGNVMEISFREMSAGTYFLIIKKEGSIVETLKTIKL